MSGVAIRVFFGVPLADEIRSSLESATRVWRQGDRAVRWVDPACYHVTLKFLGEFPVSRESELMEAVRRCVAEIAPFEMTVAGVGVFPSWSKPRVLWAGVEEGEDQLSVLAQALEAAGREFSLPAERSDYHAHVTLGRVRSWSWPGSGNWKELSDRRWGREEVTEFLFYESILGRSGPSYLVRASIKLEGNKR